MRIYPAIDIRHGQTVQLVGGDPANVAVEGKEPHAQAQRWRSKQARRVHVVDLDAALGGERQWQHVHRIVDTGLEVQFGGGVRSMTQVQQLLDMGVHRVVVGTQGVEHPYWARELGIVFPDRIVQAIDARGGKVVVKGWTERTSTDVVDCAKELDDAGFGAYLYTDVDKEGRLEGIATERIEALRAAAEQTELVVSGGITTTDDLDTLAGLGVDGVVLGMSVYKGTIDLQEAVRRFEPQAGRPR